ncbi:MAG: FAD-dependent oxidoreductase [Microgenomates group bacterium]
MTLTLVKKTDEAKGTKSFYFKPSEDFTFEAGQYIYIILPSLKYEDARGDTRHFTISSSPTETEDNLLRITTRMRDQSGYKKTLDELEIGATVAARGPQGFFVLNSKKVDTTSPQIFLAGGIGITPFRSIIKYNLDKGLNIPIHLIYSNSDSEFVFKSELDLWQTQNQNLKIDYFDSSKEGHLDSDKLKTLLPATDFKQTTFWAVGPNPFIDAMEEIFEKLEIPEDNIKTEKFTGY